MSPLFTSKLAILAGLFVAAFVWSPSAAQAESLDLELRTIYAHQADAPAVDSKLEAIAEELKTSFPGYNAFALVATERHALTLDIGTKITLPDVDGSILEIKFAGWADGESDGAAVKLARLAIGLAGKIGTEVKATPGSVFYQAGLLYKDGILILAFKLERTP